MNCLAISVHPDDETLGCGGALLRHREAGDVLYWLIVTQAHEPQWSREVIARKAEEVAKVAEAYGMTQVLKLGLPTMQLDTLPQWELIDRLRDAITEVKPEVIYLIHGGDIHTDHHAVFTAAMSVLKPFHAARLGVRRVLCYETLSSTEAAPPLSHRLFVPNVFCDISAFIERKIEIMRLFATEAQPEPLPRGPSAIRALARLRGATVGLDFAEAFMLIRETM
jgi:LmbE family N-acetylglucosaminyl deacetylase